jgi:hypothetical protein
MGPLALPLILGGASFLGGMFGGKKQKTTSSSQSSGTSSNSMTPTLAPEYSPLQKTLLPMIQQRLMNPQALNPAYERSGIKQINRTYDLAGQSLGNSLAARGMSRSGMAGNAEGRLAGGRAGDIVNFQESLPILADQQRQQDVSNAMNLMQMGRGYNTTGTHTGTQTGTSTTGGGGGLGGGLNSLTDMLGFMYGSGMIKLPGQNMDVMKQGPTPWGPGGYYD